jgi:hypothetical protein
MKTLMIIAAAIAAGAAPLAASDGTEAAGTSLLVILFLGFGALIVVCQLVPGLVLFCSMIKGLFSGSVKKTLPVLDGPKGAA